MKTTRGSLPRKLRLPGGPNPCGADSDGHVHHVRVASLGHVIKMKDFLFVNNLRLPNTHMSTGCFTAILLFLSNLVVTGILIHMLSVISNFSAEHRQLAFQVSTARQDISTMTKYFESPAHRERIDNNRNKWINELLRTLRNCSRCDGLRVNHEDKSENRFDGAIPIGMGILSEIFSFCLLSGGFVLLFKLAYSEYLEFLEMKNEERREDGFRKKNQISVSAAEFFGYRVDFYFSSNSFAKPMVLCSITFIIISVSCFIRMAIQGESLSDALWISWTYVADPGTHADSKGFARVLGFVTTVAGMLVFALMIGVVSDSIGASVDELKRGNAKVVESGHTLILGWSEKGLALLQQIALANKSDGGLPVVVLCSQNKEEMENMVRAATCRKEDRLELHGSRVIFRNGNTTNEHDLVIFFAMNQVSAARARSIVILSQDGIAPDDADSRTARQILSLQQVKTITGYLKGHIVVELQDIDNLAMTNMVGKKDVEVIVSHELIGRLMLLAARSPWVSPVLSSLMGFEGAEFYFKAWPTLQGTRFGSIHDRFDGAIPIGIKLAHSGRILVNPPDDLVIGENDQIIVLADDNDSYRVNDLPPQVSGKYMDLKDRDRRVLGTEQPLERVLFCGWRRDMLDMIHELDYDVKPGSELWLFNNVPMQEREMKMLDKGNRAPLRLKNLKIRHAVGNPTNRRQLLSLQEISDGLGTDGIAMGEPTGHRVVLSYFTSILILSDCTSGDFERDVEASDSRSLSTTLGIQDIQQASMLRMSALGKTVELFPPISEILDIRTAKQMQLISKGYVMSNHLVASYLAMVSEDRNVNEIYRELLSGRGSEIQIRRVDEYVKIDQDEAFSFWDVFQIAKKFNDVLIGYIRHQADRPKKLRRGLMLEGNDDNLDEILLNPRDKQSLRRWHAQDRLILISLCRRARRKSEMRLQRAQAEEELRRNMLSVDNFEIQGWIKKLGAGHQRAIDMDDERSWRDRLVFVVDGSMYYVSEKRRGDRELVCHLDDICHVEVGNGWPPGHFTFKIYFAPEDKKQLGKSHLSLDLLPSKVFSTSTMEECQAWIKVLSKGIEIGGEDCEYCKSIVLHRKNGGSTIGNHHANQSAILSVSEETVAELPDTTQTHNAGQRQRHILTQDVKNPSSQPSEFHAAVQTSFCFAPSVSTETAEKLAEEQATVAEKDVSICRYTANEHVMLDQHIYPQLAVRLQPCNANSADNGEVTQQLLGSGEGMDVSSDTLVFDNYIVSETHFGNTFSTS